MAKLIKQLHDYIDFYIGKNVGSSFSPSNKDLVIQEIQIIIHMLLMVRYKIIKNNRLIWLKKQIAH